MKRQGGAALLIALLVIVLTVTFGLLAAFNSRNLQTERGKITEAALAQAKSALIAYATSVQIDPAGPKRPGDLPCPDTNNDGVAELSCGNGSGTTGQVLRLGRLPWKTLGLSDLRDESGERLWYAVSSNFKNNTRYTGTLNSDTLGTISIRDASGNLLRDAQANQGVVAVIIAPGATITRPTSVSDATPYNQNRDTTGENDPRNYLDLAVGEDNADFDEITFKQNGFIAGPVRDTNRTIIANDKMAWISPEELVPALEKRVIAEVSKCLLIYTADPANLGRYPWPAASSLGTSGAVSYADTANVFFGRLPDKPFSNTQTSSAPAIPAMKDGWFGDCNINTASGWWLNWKEVIFYGIADYHKPNSTQPINSCSPASPQANCLSFDGAVNRQFVVIAAGRQLSTQQRSSLSNKNLLSNYLEGGNAGGTLFSAPLPSATFNDKLLAFP